MRLSQLVNRIRNYALPAAATLSVLAFGGVDQQWFVATEIIVLLVAGHTFWLENLPQLGRGTRIVLLALVIAPLLQLVPLPQSVVILVSPLRAILNSALM